MNNTTLTIIGRNGGEATLEAILAVIEERTQDFDRNGEGLGISDVYRLINDSNLPEDVQSIVAGFLIDYKNYARGAGVDTEEVFFEPEVFSNYARNMEDGGVAFFSETFPKFAPDAQMLGDNVENSGVDGRLTDDDNYLSTTLAAALRASSGWVVEDGDVNTPVWEAMNAAGGLDEIVNIDTNTLQEMRFEQLDKNLELEEKSPSTIGAEQDAHSQVRGGR